MLRSCKYCGRIHDVKNVCVQKKQAEEKRCNNRKDTDAFKFRKTKAWTNKSIRIRERDAYMCLCCKAGLVGATREINGVNLSVHHITPIAEDYSKRLDDSNLITVCDIHHELCESGVIDRETQRQLVLESIHRDGSELSDECIVL